MKKALYAVALLLSLSIMSSCDKNGEESLSDYLQGIWIVEFILPPDVDPNWDSLYLQWYLEFGDNGVLTEYHTDPAKYAKFQEPVLYVPTGVTWKPDKTYTYSVSENKLSFGGFSGTIEKRDNYTFFLDVKDNHFSGTYHRIRSFKTLEEDTD